MKEIKIKNKLLQLPAYFPDGTRAVVRSLDSIDLKKAGVEGMIVNTYHLYKEPGDEYLYEYGGVAEFMNWDGFVVSDSGGFQIMSMIYKSGKGKITSEGVFFDDEVFTPEKSIEVQFNLGSDIIIVLDYFTNPKAGDLEIEESVKITTEWAKRCKEEYERQIERRKLKKDQRPLLLAVIQGGRNKAARERSAKELVKIGFDGYGFGGWIIDEDGKLDLEIAKFNAELTPDDKIRFALGVGKPEDIVRCFEYGYHIFDCVLPTRDARHKRLYKFLDKPENLDFNFEFYEFIYPIRKKYKYQKTPIDPYCDCYACSASTLPYLRHLYKIGDTLAFRLATIHNLRFYTRIMHRLRESSRD